MLQQRRSRHRGDAFTAGHSAFAVPRAVATSTTGARPATGMDRVARTTTIHATAASSATAHVASADTAYRSLPSVWLRQAPGEYEDHGGRNRG